MALLGERLDNIERQAREEYYKMAMNTSGLVTPMQPAFAMTDFNADSEITFRIGKVQDLQMIAMRLRLPQGVRYPFDFINCHLAQDKAFVFIVKDGQAVTLEDDAHNFPSDELIAKLRLLIG